MNDSSVQIPKKTQFHHVGVTAKIASPLNVFLQNSSSTDTDCGYLFSRNSHATTTKYNKFSNETSALTCESSSSTTDNSKNLYEMKTVQEESAAQVKLNTTPSKIEFQLYRKQKCKFKRHSRKFPTARKLKMNDPKRTPQKPIQNNFNNLYDNSMEQKMKKPSLLERFRSSLMKIKSATSQGTSTKLQDSPKSIKNPSECSFPANDTRIRIYPFDHGCADFLRTTDCPPHIVSEVLAERATRYATRFWSEVFGSLHIGVAFFVTFLLQTYRFLLYSLINTLLVGFLHMTSDYLIKPILTVTFNGFLQPPLIFIYNILTSLRDLLRPIAETLDNFLKPVATVTRSVRFVHVNYNRRTLQKEI